MILQFIEDDGVTGDKLTLGESPIADGDVLVRDGRHITGIDPSALASGEHTIMQSDAHTDSTTSTAATGGVAVVDATNKWMQLPGNTTTTKNFLTSTGTGAASARPEWDTIEYSDIPDNIFNVTQLTAFIAANPSEKCNVHIFGAIAITANYNIPTNIRVHIERGCLFTISANMTLTINTIDDPPDYQFVDISASGSKIVFSSDVYYNPIWTGAHGDGITDDSGHFTDLGRSLALTGAPRWIVLNHNHLLNSSPTGTFKIKFNAPNGKITHGFNGTLNLDQIQCEDNTHVCFVCSSTLRYITLANQETVYVTWFGAVAGATGIDTGLPFTLASQSGANEILASPGSYYFLTSGVYKNSQQTIRCKGKSRAIFITESTTLRSILRRVNFDLNSSTPLNLTDNGSGYVRVTMAAHLVELNSSISIRSSLVGGYNTTGIVTLVSSGYFDTNVVYVSDSTGIVSIYDGTQKTKIRTENISFVMPNANTGSALWFYISYYWYTQTGTGGIAESTFEDCTISNSSIGGESIGLTIGYGWRNVITNCGFYYLKTSILLEGNNRSDITKNRFNNVELGLYQGIGNTSVTMQGNYFELPDCPFLITAGSSNFKFYDNMMENPGPILITDNDDTYGPVSACSVVNFEICSNILSSGENIFLYINLTDSDSRVQGRVYNNEIHSDYLVNNDGESYGILEERASNYFNVVYENNSFCGKNNLTISSVNLILARLNGIRIPVSNIINNTGIKKDIGSEYEFSEAWNPGTIDNETLISREIHVPWIDKDSFFVDKVQFTRNLPVGITIESHITDSENTISEVDFKNNGSGGVNAEKADISDYISEEDQKIVVNGTSDYDGTWRIAPVSSGAILLKESMAAAPAGWPSGGYAHRSLVTADKTLVPSDQTDIPLCIDLSLLTTFWDYVDSDGDDIRLYNGAGTPVQIPFEITDWDYGAETGFIWFKADSVLNSADTTFGVYCGLSSLSALAVGDTYGRNAVWSGGYKIASHMNQHDTNQIYDSSGNLDGTNSAPTALINPSFMGDGFQHRASTADYVYWGDVYNPGASDFAISFMFKSSQTGANKYPFCKYYNLTGQHGFQVVVNNTSIFLYTSSNGNTDDGIAYNNSLSNICNGTWKHIAIIKSGTTATIISGGVSVAVTGTPVATVYSVANSLCQGLRRAVAGTIAGSTEASEIDELRYVVGVTKTANYFITQYANTTNPNFWKTITEETADNVQTGTINYPVVIAQIKNQSGESTTIDSGYINGVCKYRPVSGNSSGSVDGSTKWGEFSVTQTVTSDTEILGSTRTLVCDSATPFNQTLPIATGSQRKITITNIGAGTVTLVCSTRTTTTTTIAPDTISDEPTITLEQHDTITVIDYEYGKWISLGGQS